MKEPRIIISLDFPDAGQALALVRRLKPAHCRLKVGKELFTRGGPELVRQLVADGFAVFLDLKFHDIPATVAGACKAAADLGVWMVNVHIAGGERMLRAAREAMAGCARPPLLIGVTVLTSLDDTELRRVGVDRPAADQVLCLARLAAACQLDGVVCSAQEASALRKEHGADFLLVTPGIRPMGSAVDDQQRITTPEAAIRAGSDYLVIGRPITRAPDPVRELAEINEEIKKVSRI